MTPTFDLITSVYLQLSAVLKGRCNDLPNTPHFITAILGRILQSGQSVIDKEKGLSIEKISKSTIDSSGDVIYICAVDNISTVFVDSIIVINNSLPNNDNKPLSNNGYVVIIPSKILDESNLDIENIAMSLISILECFNTHINTDYMIDGFVDRGGNISFDLNLALDEERSCIWWHKKSTLGIEIHICIVCYVYMILKSMFVDANGCNFDVELLFNVFKDMNKSVKGRLTRIFKRYCDSYESFQKALASGDVIRDFIFD